MRTDGHTGKGGRAELFLILVEYLKLGHIWAKKVFPRNKSDYRKGPGVTQACI